MQPALVTMGFPQPTMQPSTRGLHNASRPKADGHEAPPTATAGVSLTIPASAGLGSSRAGLFTYASPLRWHFTWRGKLCD